MRSMTALSERLPPLRAGLMVPANNTTMERELLGWLPPGSTCQTLRVPRGQGLLTAETVPAYLAASLELAETFACDLDVIVYGCTAASFIAGLEADRMMARRIRALRGVAVVTATGSMLAELGEVQARSIGLVTPYSDAVNAALEQALSGDGIKVVRIERLPAPDVEALGRLTAEDAAGAAQRLTGTPIDAVFIACSQLPTAAILDGVGSHIGVPVLSSIQASAAQAMRRLAATGGAADGGAARVGAAA